MIHEGPTTLADDELSLREVTTDEIDIQALYELRMDDETRHMFRHTSVVSYEDHVRFVTRYFAEENNDCWFVVEVGAQIVGTLALCDLDREQGICELSRVIIAPRFRGRGYGKRAVQLLHRFAGELGFERIRAEVLASNTVQRNNLAGIGYADGDAYTIDGRRFVEVHLQLPAKL